MFVLVLFFSRRKQVYESRETIDIIYRFLLLHNIRIGQQAIIFCLCLYIYF